MIYYVLIGGKSTMKKINYRVADAVFLIIVFIGLKALDKYILETLKYNKNSIFMAISVSLIFLGIYVNLNYSQLCRESG